MPITNLHNLIDAADSPSAAELPAGRVARDLREAAGLTPTDLAAAVGVAERSWSRFERGVSTRFLTRTTDLRAARVLAHVRQRLDAACVAAA